MSGLSNRLARIEAATPKPERPMLTMFWGSPANDAAADDLRRRADAEGKDSLIIKLVGPENRS